jgi:hypothetical protein
MRFMNDYDLAMARRRFGYGNTPNRLALVMVVDNLREWANQNSDGWAYWPKPVRAAAKAIALIDSTTNEGNRAQEREDITDAEMRAAVAPIKAFLTRQKVDPRDREIILRAIEVAA